MNKNRPYGFIRAIDGQGRIQIPSECRKRLGINKDDKAEILCYDNRIVIRAANSITKDNHNL